MTATEVFHPPWQRPVAVLLLLLLGVASLPLSAAMFDGEGSENWILPTAVAVMVVLGAAVGSALPGLAGRAASRGRGAASAPSPAWGCSCSARWCSSLLLNGLSGA